MKKYRGIILGYGILSLVLCIPVSCMNPKKTNRPNILIILIDDQDMDEIYTYGGDVYTPNMDRLAEEGMMHLLRDLPKGKPERQNPVQRHQKFSLITIPGAGNI